MQSDNTDILIIGSGISGLLCALLCATEKSITILTKKTIQDSTTMMAQGGVAGVVTKTGDIFASHIDDTLRAGEKHNDKVIVKDVITSAPTVIEQLKKYGVEFDTDLTLEGGHSHRRIHHSKDTTGEALEKALIKAVRKHKNIRVIPSAHAIDLIVKNKKCTGAYYLKRNKIHAIQGQVTVLATGGMGQLYRHTTNPKISTGDGIAMAHRASVKTKDMEFIQFHPTALLDGYSPHFLLSESLRGEGATLRNSKGETFMRTYHPQGDLAPRDKVSRAIFLEQKNGPVFLDITHKETFWLKKRFPKIYTTILARTKKDLSRDLIPITPAAHYICGGIVTDRNGETTLSNLYAIGETAWTGLHGANRLASNSLLEGAVFAIKAAAAIQKQLSQARTSKNSKAFKTSTFSTPPLTIPGQPYKLKKIRNRIQELMWSYAGIQRSEQGLKKALFELKRLTTILPPEHFINTEILETKNMLEVAILIVQAAQQRKKSLGCHWFG